MSEETNVDVSYLSCDINGTKYIYKIAPYPMDMIKDTFSEEQNTDDIVKETQLENEEESISLVYLNGQVYAFQNGVLQELDTNQIMEQTNFYEKAFLVSKDVENCGNEYITNENIVVKNTYTHSEEQYEVATEEAEKNLIIEDDNVNVDDFVEIVTAFKCKICAYITQNKIQLLGHIQKIHLNSTIDIEVNNLNLKTIVYNFNKNKKFIMQYKLVYFYTYTAKGRI